MRRLFPLGLLIACVSLSMGCATCCSPYDYAYGYTGGAWQRDDLCNGRVGSVFAPAGSRVVAAKQPRVPESEAPNILAPPAADPEAKPPEADLNTEAARPLKSVKRTRPASPDRSYLPVND